MTKLLAHCVLVMALLNTMSARYSRYPFPAALGQRPFLAVPKSCGGHQTLCVSAWKRWALLGNSASASRASWKPCRHHPVLRGCGSRLLEEVWSLLLILYIPNPACAGEMSTQVLAMTFRQLLSGSLCLDLAGRGTL